MTFAFPFSKTVVLSINEMTTLSINAAFEFRFSRILVLSINATFAFRFSKTVFLSSSVTFKFRFSRAIVTFAL